jgi:hypothetical protein
VVADGFVDLPTDPAKPVDAYCDCHGVDSFMMRYDHLCVLTNLTVI